MFALQKPKARPVLDCQKGVQEEDKRYFTRTEAEHAESVDIHKMMGDNRSKILQLHNATHGGTYGDYTNEPDFRESMTAIADADSMFQTLPADLRFDFENDPGRFLEFVQDEENRSEIEAYGLSTAHLPPLPETPAPQPAPAPSPEPPCDDD